jgi:hypothetical protein
MSEPIQEKTFPPLPEKPGRKRRTQADLLFWINKCLERTIDSEEYHTSRLGAKAQISVLMWALGYTVEEAHAYIEQVEAEAALASAKEQSE